MVFDPNKLSVVIPPENKGDEKLHSDVGANKQKRGIVKRFLKPAVVATALTVASLGAEAQSVSTPDTTSATKTETTSETKAQLKKNVFERLEKGKTNRDELASLVRSINYYIDEAWAEEVLRKVEKIDPTILPQVAYALIKKPFGQKILAEALTKSPKGVRTLVVEGNQKITPELDTAIVRGFRSVLAEGKQMELWPLLDLPPDIYKIITGGEDILIEIMRKDDPYGALFSIKNNSWISPEKRRGIIKEKVTNARYPENLMEFVDQFSAEPYADSFVRKVYVQNPEQIFVNVNKLSPKEKYQSFIREMVNEQMALKPSNVLFYPDVMRFIARDTIEYDSIVEQAVRGCADQPGHNYGPYGILGSEVIAGKYAVFAEKPYAYEMLKKALLRDPQAVHELDKEYYDFAQKRYKPIYIKTR